MTEAPVLVTGAAGFVGSHTVNELLRSGYRVRAAVRGDRKAQSVRETVAAAGLDPAAVEFVVVELTADDGWAAAVAGTRYVLHIASPFPAAPPEDADDVIVPARDGTLRVLRHARAAACERVVMTSSFAAVGYSPKPTAVWTERDWTDPGDDNSAYVRSKAIAERAAWDFVGDGGPPLTTLVPTGIFGPVLGSPLSASVLLIESMLRGAAPNLPPDRFGIVDVRDVATAHVRAMTTGAAAGERILLVADGPSRSFRDIARLLRESLGEQATRVITENGPDPVSGPKISNAKAKSLLGWNPRPVADTIVDTARSLLGSISGAGDTATARSISAE